MIAQLVLHGIQFHDVNPMLLITNKRAINATLGRKHHMNLGLGNDKYNIQDTI